MANGMEECSCGLQNSWCILGSAAVRTPNTKHVFIEMNTVASFRNGRQERPLCFKLELIQGVDGCLTITYSLHIHHPVRAFTANNRAHFWLDRLQAGRPFGSWQGSGAHPASCAMCTEGFVLEGKAAGTWSWQFTSIQCRGYKCMELYLKSPICLDVVLDTGITF
jgi:hypothetical protein